MELCVFSTHCDGRSFFLLAVCSLTLARISEQGRTKAFWNLPHLCPCEVEVSSSGLVESDTDLSPRFLNLTVWCVGSNVPTAPQAPPPHVLLGVGQPHSASMVQTVCEWHECWITTQFLAWWAFRPPGRRSPSKIARALAKSKLFIWIILSGSPLTWRHEIRTIF